MAGSFGLKDKVGQAWARALKKDGELRKAYEQVGKQYSAQRDFRQTWAKERFQEINDAYQGPHSPAPHLAGAGVGAGGR